MWHRLVETTCHASQALAFCAKKKLDIILRYDSHHLLKATVQWCHQLMNRTKLWLFLDILLAMLLADLHAKINNFAYLHIHWATNEHAMTFLNRARILIIKFNDLQALLKMFESETKHEMWVSCLNQCCQKDNS